MKLNPIFDTSMAVLNKVLDLRAQKEKVIASNIANSETPGYAPTRFEFENELQQAIGKNSFPLQTTHSQHIPIQAGNLQEVRGVTFTEPDTSKIGDQNGVSIDEEMLALSENELMYETSAQLLKKKLNILKYVIQGGS